MKTARWLPIFSILALAFLLIALPAAAQDKTVIRVGSPFKPGHILVDAAEKFKALVTQETGGRIEVQIDAGTKSEEEINTLNSTGTLEMQSNGTMFLQVYAPPTTSSPVPTS